MTRTGLKRLECADQCGALAYMTLSQLERFGLPGCPCGARMVPEDLEVALTLGVETSATAELRQRTYDKERSQLRSIGRQGEMLRRLDGTLNDMTARALEEIDAERRAAVRTRRISGLIPVARAAQAAAQTVAEIPF